MKGICKVCELVDNNTTIKSVKFCKVCNAFICHLCRPNMLKRAKAMFIEIKSKQNS